ncbi:hypothetical protein N657DRAFT_453205 [Parathielavia appendiculata]|uniref:Uncharacterized protein n=1 Tax=Parathielavia appendiculata TaxID=2587402 RepID=A0AAN6TYR0_9PEZI|nr:hypothetical protein N657DRAFT_453205 [Parathielavia appendiculata]
MTSTGTKAQTPTEDETTTLSSTVTTTATTTTTVNSSTSSSTTLMHTWGTGGVGTIGTASFTMHSSANGSCTYSLPTVSPSHPLTTIVSSSASAGGRGQGGGGKGNQRGVKGGFYCVVMAVACGFSLMV